MAIMDRNKERALIALMECRTLTAAAEAAGISRRTLYNYLTEDDAFASTYRDMVEQAQLEQFEQVEEIRKSARTTIRELMEDKGQPAAVRLKAASLVLEMAAEMENKGMNLVRENAARATIMKRRR